MATLGKYPAKAHARKVAEYMRQISGGVEGLDDGVDNGLLYLEGQKLKFHEVRLVMLADTFAQ